MESSYSILWMSCNDQELLEAEDRLRRRRNASAEEGEVRPLLNGYLDEIQAEWLRRAAEDRTNIGW